MASMYTLKNNQNTGTLGSGNQTISAASAGSVGPGGTSSYQTPSQPSSAYGNFADYTRGQSSKYLGGTGLNNPYDASRFQNFSNQLWGNLFGKGGGSGGSGGGGFNWGMGYPAPNDPMVKGYMGNIEGGTRNMVDDYVSRSAYAGPQRGTMGIAGGADARAAQGYGATKAIASDYANRYDQAMGYGKDYYGAGADNWKAGLGLMQSLLGNELGVQQGSADFLLGQAGIGRDLNAQELQGRTGQSQENQYYYGKQFDASEAARNYERQKAMQDAAWGREDTVDARNWQRQEDARKRQEAIDQTNRVQQTSTYNRGQQDQAAAESILNAYNQRFNFGNNANMSYLSDWLAKQRGQGQYGRTTGGR